MKRVLITGKNSYIGTSVENWLNKSPDKYLVDTLEMKNSDWMSYDFSTYDVVFHVAGIAHVPTNSSLDDLYYKVNRDLTIDVARKCKQDDVGQIIFMSSLIVYGDSKKSKQVINTNTQPEPSNAYGKSKFQAEEVIRGMQDSHFKVVILRPPMVYGKGSKGNYPLLAKFAKYTPIFPDITNERSMLHIDNLCEFIKGVIDLDEEGVFFPQNAEYVCTSSLVKAIAEVHGKRIYLTKIFNPIIKLMSNVGIVNKVFGNLVYDKSMSIHGKINYQIRDFKESIELTEMEDKYDCD